MQDLLDEIAAAARPAAAEGRVAHYIPALASVGPSKFALVIRLADGTEAASGDADEPFSLQSISKLFALALAMDRVGAALWDRVGREPSGMRFNSLIQLETENGRPRNPFINAGAIAVTDALVTACPGYPDALRDDIRALSGSDRVDFDETVFQSERRSGDLNRAMAYVLKAHRVIDNDPMAVADAYFRACSLTVTARELTRAAMFLVAPEGGLGAVAHGSHAQRIRAIMRTCGLYDQAGEFAFRVGLPGKSGVGGGIVVTQPRHFAATAWSPPLDRFGNSVAGQEALERLARALC